MIEEGMVRWKHEVKVTALPQPIPAFWHWHNTTDGEGGYQPVTVLAVMTEMPSAQYEGPVKRERIAPPNRKPFTSCRLPDSEDDIQAALDISERLDYAVTALLCWDDAFEYVAQWLPVDHICADEETAKKEVLDYRERWQKRQQAPQGEV